MILVGTVGGLVIAMLDIFTGFFVGDRTFDALLLAGCGLGLWGLLSMRQIARRVLTDELPVKPSPYWWAGEALSHAVAIGVLAGMGYLIGGRWLALVAGLSYPVYMAITIGLGIRKHRRTRTAEPP